jgi:lipopolysaccharide export system permease protein
LKKLHRFILISYIGPLFLAFFIVVFLLLMQFLWKYIDDLAGKGLSASIISELLLYASASMVPMALPLAILLSSLMTFGNMGEHYELIAMKSSGISLQRVMAPLVVLVFFISIFAFFFFNNVMPFANLKMMSLLYDVQQKRPEFQIREGIFYAGIENYSIKVGEKDNRTNRLQDIKIYDHSEGKGNTSVTTADSGYMKMTADSNLVLELYNGYTYNEMSDHRVRNRKNYPARRDHFEEQKIILSMTGFQFNRTDETLFKGGYKMMNVKQLRKAIDSLNGDFASDKNQFTRDLLLSSYFKGDKAFKKSLDKDTAQSLKPRLKKINTYAIYDTLSIQQKRSVLDQSLNLVRATRSHIVAQKDNFYGKVKRIRKHEIELHRKLTLSFACFIFFFIGAPLGAIIRRGGLGMPVVVSVVFFLLYYVISLTGEKLVREDIMPVYEGMWISSFILLPLGVYLTYKATTDAAILNIDTYINFFKKIAGFMRIRDWFNFE